jgi:phage-related protein (TIGR01555 family)
MGVNIMNDIVPIAPPQLTTLDGLTNVMTGLGTAKSKRSYNQWEYSALNDYSTLDACYQSNWIARKICDIPAEDMTREWRRIKCEGAEDIAALEQQLLVPNMVQEALTWARLYGGAGILMITGQDLTKPLRIDQIRKGDLKRLLVLDRWDMASGIINTWDVLASNYLKPEHYMVRGGAMQIHHSHFARFSGERLPLRHMAQTQGWGDSVLRKCLDDITDMVAAKDGIAELMQEANIDVITRTGLTDELSTDQDDTIIKRYELFSMMKSSIQMALLDGDEKFDRMTLNLSGVAPIIEQFMTWISGAADIPVTRMFGTSAKGMNATGEGDDRNYNNSIRAGQRSYMAEPMRTLDEVLVRSALGNFPDDFDYVWNPLSLPNDLQNAQADKLRADKHMLYLADGIVQKSQIMRELQASEEYQFDDEAIDELEELEEGNMFEEPVDTTDPIAYAANYTESNPE